MAIQVAKALQYAHDRRVNHRDIKPANLLLDSTGNVWVADFGLAKLEDNDLTQTGGVVGTLRYIAPERFKGVCDPRADIYLLGATLYELVATKPVFSDFGKISLMEQIQNSQPIPMREIDREIPRDLQTIIEKALSKDPSRRYSTAQQFGDDLKCFVNGQPISARRVTAVEKLGLWAKQNKAVASLLVVLVVGSLFVAATAGYAAVTYREMANEQLRLREEADEGKSLAEAEAKKHKAVRDLMVSPFCSSDPTEESKDITVLESLSSYVVAIREAKDVEPKTIAELLGAIGETFLNIGAVEEALELFIEAQEIVVNESGPDDHYSIHWQVFRAMSLIKLGRGDEA